MSWIVPSELHPNPLGLLSWLPSIQNCYAQLHRVATAAVASGAEAVSQAS